MSRCALVVATFSAFFLAASISSQTKKDNPQIAQAGVNGVGVPACAYCPLPEYTDQARKARIEGQVLVQAVVTADGRAENVSIRQGLGSGLDEKAIEAVKKWRFKPAHNAQGHPTAVVVPMHVTFRLK
jgi:protein TonB